MNTGFLGPVVATVLTVYGIETNLRFAYSLSAFSRLQQYLPFTVLKQGNPHHFHGNNNMLQQYLPFTVLKLLHIFRYRTLVDGFRCNSTYRLRYWNCYCSYCKWRQRRLQQYLPFTVLKQKVLLLFVYKIFKLQQYLPFTVLKLPDADVRTPIATAELQQYLPFTVLKLNPY